MDTSFIVVGVIACFIGITTLGSMLSEIVVSSQKE